MNEKQPLILVVDDDEITASNINHALGKHGFAVEWVETGEAALASLAKGGFDALVLDRMLPGIDGLHVLRSMRSSGIVTPTIFLSALATIDNRVEGLDAGADDYLVKPFAMTELIARLNALLRSKQQRQTAHIVVYHQLTLDRIRKSATIESQSLELLAKEFEMLNYLVEHSEQVVTRQMLLEELWGYRFETGTNVIDVHVSRLRKKIEKKSDRLLLLAERGIGYRLIWQ